jgi:two-component system nitrogen regulation response regulator GlnG
MTRKPTILVADDDASIRTIVSETLERAGFNVVAVSSGAALWSHVLDGVGDVIITDVVMPDADGLELVPQIIKQRPNVPIIVISAQNTLQTAVRATEQGAYDYIPKPFDINELVDIVKKSLKVNNSEENLVSQTIADETTLIGRSKVMQTLYRNMARLMGSDLTVLIQGESGTGKELVAKALHDMGLRKEKPFVAINMAAIPKELIESELFGHNKGSFTGADSNQKGRFEDAEGGTLFLDEIGDMPKEAQTRLLRVLQQGEYRKIGGGTPIKTNVRIISATHKKLQTMVREGSFREDLFYRLNVVPLSIPPLRKRVDDIEDLVGHFMKKAEKEGLPAKMLGKGAFACLKKHSWPGNVRELENLIRRLCALYSEDTISEANIKKELEVDSDNIENINQDNAGKGLSSIVQFHLERYFKAHEHHLPTPGFYGRFMKEIERPLIETSLKATGGNQLKAADMLGLNRNTLRKKINQLKITIHKDNS